MSGCAVEHTLTPSGVPSRSYPSDNNGFNKVGNY